MLATLQNCCLSAGNLSGEPTQQALVGGLRSATLLLIAVPLLLVLGLGWRWRALHRQSR